MLYHHSNNNNIVVQPMCVHFAPLCLSAIACFSFFLRCSSKSCCRLNDLAYGFNRNITYKFLSGFFFKVVRRGAGLSMYKVDQYNEVHMISTYFLYRMLRWISSELIIRARSVFNILGRGKLQGMMSSRHSKLSCSLVARL